MSVRMRIALHLLLLLALPCFGTLNAASNSSSDCNQSADHAITYLALPGRPFQPVPSSDGCWIFVSMAAQVSRSERGIAVVHRFKGKQELKRLFATNESLTGMTLTHDDQLLIAGTGKGVLFIDANRLVAGENNPVVGQMATSSSVPSASYLSVTADDRFLFVSNESAGTISVINLEFAKQKGYNSEAIVGTIATGRAPIAVTLSSNDRYLYSTSEIGRDRSGWPSTCHAEQANGMNANLHPQGMLIVVDVSRAKTDPANSVVARIPAGCSPVRLVLSPDGGKAYVTARGDNALLIFDTGRLLSDPSHAKLASVSVGPAPVGVALVNGGSKAIVANSNRFSEDAKKQNLSVVDLAGSSPMVVGSIPAQRFPRELRLTADKACLFVTNFASKTLEVVDLDRLSDAMGRK